MQRRSTYPNDSDTPTATCHLQPAEDARALCGYQWEGLVRVPGAKSFDDITEELRCPRCVRASEPDAITRSSAGCVGRFWGDPRVHPACFLGSELFEDFDPGGEAGCETRAYGSTRVG